MPRKALLLECGTGWIPQRSISCSCPPHLSNLLSCPESQERKAPGRKAHEKQISPQVVISPGENLQEGVFSDEYA